jgi:protein-arginine kinase activator protein McsA
MCEVCGKPGIVHMTEIRDGQKTTRSLCLEHAPADMRDKMPFGPHRTPAEEVAFLRDKMALLDQKVSDPAQRAEFKAEIEQLISDIEAGRRRIGDAD